MESIPRLHQMMMHPGKHVVLAMLVLPTLVVTAGCGEPPDLRDQRLVEFARESMTEQRKQNDRLADQSQSVVQESQQLTEAAKELVQHDAEARRELVASQRELNSQIASQRSTLDAGRDQLEGERRQIAEQRHRDPLIASAIQNTGILIACLLPLIVCLFVIRQLNRDEPDHAAIAELLMTEFTSEQPRLLPGPARRAVALEKPDADDSRDAPLSEEPAANFDPPF
jgi:hypothetical protein